MAKIPRQYAHEPELVKAVIDARRIQMETGDNDAAIEQLTKHPTMSRESATRTIENVTFKYVAMYPEGHPHLPKLKADLAERSRKSQIKRGMRLQVIERDGEGCQHCNRRVTGRNSELELKDPDMGQTVENLHIVCRRCCRLKEDLSWAEFQHRWAQRFGHGHTKRIVDAIFGTEDYQLDQLRIRYAGQADRCARCHWVIIGDYALNEDDLCTHCVLGTPRTPEFHFPPQGHFPGRRYLPDPSTDYGKPL